jgi:hypothetical protein
MNGYFSGLSTEKSLRNTDLWLNRDKYVTMITVVNVTESDRMPAVHSLCLALELVLVSRIQITK